MCRSSAAALLLVCAGALAAPASSPGRHGIGRVPTAQEIAGWDIAVRPDGKGLPKGSGSVARGEKPYEEKCAVCHGSFGESNEYHVLSGGRGSLGTREPVRSVGSKWQYATTLFDYIRRAMPMNAPQTLSTEEVYSLTAYVLYLNDILKADAVLDEKTLPQVRMPNADGFTTAHGLSRVDGRPDTKNTACMRNCIVEVAVKSELPGHAKGLHGEPVSPGDAMARGAPQPAAPQSEPAAKPAALYELAKKSGCTACHGLANKLVGPAFRDVAARYKSDAGAEARLAAKLRAGGGGSWGAVPMPPQSQLADGEAKALVQWILAGATNR